jgi:hypothetical protein
MAERLRIPFQGRLAQAGYERAKGWTFPVLTETDTEPGERKLLGRREKKL